MKFFSSLQKATIVLIILLTIFVGMVSPGVSSAAQVKPYKVALVIGDQWDDPMSFLVSPRGDEFSSLIIMLKSWCIPFEIIRLDQEFMDINRFIGPDGKPDVGCIIFDADQTSEKLLPQHYEVLREAVNDYGISLIALFDRIKEPIIQELLGIEYVGYWTITEPLKHTGDHFITQGLANPLDSYKVRPRTRRVQAKIGDTTPIVTQGEYAQATVRELPSGAKAVWIGGDTNQLFSHQAGRTLLRRAITYCIGYSLFKTWENKAWLTVDDPGGAQNVWSEHWHYPTMTEEQIDEHLIKPLKENDGLLIIYTIPGFVNDELRRVEPSFKRKFIDEFGTLQDGPSTLRGLRKGLKAGVFEIQCHGLTHLQPDLYSPPGPWYGADLYHERAEMGWYREFADTRRNKEIPAAEALWRMKTGKQWLKYLFGVTTLSIRPNGGATSKSYVNNTNRIAAAHAGFGWAGGRAGYLGTDMAVGGWTFEGTLECPLYLRVPPDGHDKGLVEHPKLFAKIFNKYPDIEWMGLNEYIGYLHTEISGGRSGKLNLQINYDSHYCRYFGEEASQWNLLVSDWLAKELGGAKIIVDGKTAVKKADFSRQLQIKIPAGIGSHSIEIN